MTLTGPRARGSVGRGSVGGPCRDAADAREPMDHGFMFGPSFSDLDGHIGDIVLMDPNHVQQ
jgi:predicted lactoylglutathione lyase